MKTKLEQLINSIPFQELSILDKEYVLENITEQEYIQFQEIILNSINAFESDSQKIEPEDRVKERLSNAFKSKHEKSFFENKMFDFPFFKSSLFKPALAFGLAAVVIFIFYPKQTPSIEVAQIKKHKASKVDQIAKIETKDSTINSELKEQIVKPVSKAVKSSILGFNENDFLAGTEIGLSENEQMCVNTGYTIQISDDYYLSLEDFISYTTILIPEIETQQLIINPEDLK
jgi:hypothetical protein